VNTFLKIYLLLCISDPNSPQLEVETNFRINFSIDGTTVKTKFGPAKTDEEYCVCVVKTNSGYVKCEKKNILPPVSIFVG